MVRVPADQPNLQAAIAAVSAGGVIEIDTGTYTAPNGGFTLYDVPKTMTIRAAAGAQVTLSGNGTHDILRFANSSIAAGRPVTFERITFSNGNTTTNFLGGAITLVGAQAIFVSCTFQNNAGNAPGTGAAHSGSTRPKFILRVAPGAGTRRPTMAPASAHLKVESTSEAADSSAIASMCRGTFPTPRAAQSSLRNQRCTSQRAVSKETRRDTLAAPSTLSATGRIR